MAKLVKCVIEYNGAHRGNIAFFIGLKCSLQKCHFQSYLSYFCSACFPSAKQFFIHWEDRLPAVYFKSSQPTHTEVHYEQKRKFIQCLAAVPSLFVAEAHLRKTVNVTVSLLAAISFSPPSLSNCPFLPPLAIAEPWAQRGLNAWI